MTEPRGFQIPTPDLIIAAVVAAIVIGGLVGLRTGSAAPPTAPTTVPVPFDIRESHKMQQSYDLRHMKPCTVACDLRKYDRDHAGNPPPPPVVKPRIAPRPSWQWRET